MLWPVRWTNPTASRMCSRWVLYRHTELIVSFCTGSMRGEKREMCKRKGEQSHGPQGRSWCYLIAQEGEKQETEIHRKPGLMVLCHKTAQLRTGVAQTSQDELSNLRVMPWPLPDTSELVHLSLELQCWNTWSPRSFFKFF